MISALVLAAASAGGIGAIAAGDSGKPGAKVSAGPAPKTPKKSMWGPYEFNGQSLFPTYRDLGVGIYNTSARWEQIAPTTRPANPTDPNDPAYQWPLYLDESVAGAEANGLEAQIMLIGTPPWANGGRSWQWVPSNPSDFADFATAVAKRYPGVNLFMIWGEPNRQPNFQPFTASKSAKGPLNKAQRVAPGNYAQLVDAAYGALKAVNPANRVIGGNTYTASGPGDINTYPWIRYLRLPNGARPRMDMWGHNPWGSTLPTLKGPLSRRGSVTFPDLRSLTKALDKAFPGPALKLYLAEWGVPTGFKDLDLGYTLKPKEGKQWIRAAFRIARGWKRIYTLGWVHPVDTDRNSTGLLDKGLKRKPGYSAYKAG